MAMKPRRVRCMEKKTFSSRKHVVRNLSDETMKKLALKFISVEGRREILGWHSAFYTGRIVGGVEWKPPLAMSKFQSEFYMMTDWWRDNPLIVPSQITYKFT